MKKIWLSEIEYKQMLPQLRDAGLYEVDRKITYWHKKPNGFVLGPKVKKG
jgi:hypothetical protein